MRALSAVFLEALDTQGDTALLGKFDGVTRVVEQCLLQSGRVAEQVGRQGSDLARQLQLLGVGALLKHGNAVADERIDRNLGFLQHELARLRSWTDQGCR
jgi:hypothetical protein